jgi:hypothetical protein
VQCRHQVDRSPRQQALAVVGSPIQHHLIERCQIDAVEYIPNSGAEYFEPFRYCDGSPPRMSPPERCSFPRPLVDHGDAIDLVCGTNRKLSFIPNG